ncbi:MAG TPA: type VI secretion system baseplate subunit TssG [Stellaceae bacterium]|nr:type VI secretion system baseplate subunit TssG [Stellaceae bacterium]
MAAFGWRTDRPVAEQLFAEPYRFDFFQAVHLLERLLPRATRVGEGSGIRPEPVRFRSSLMAAFPASEIDRLALGARPGDPPEMLVNFMGLAGGFGPLPPPLSEHVLARARRGDTAACDFLDVFNHRLVSLFYRARAKHRPSLARGTPADSNFALYVFALFGLALAELRGRMPVPDRALLHYGGILAQAPRSLHGLERVLADYFGVPVAGASLDGRWLAIDEAERTRIGRNGRNHGLGRGAVLGRHVWDQQAGIRLTLGPLGLARLQEFLPGGSAHRRLHGLASFYAEAPLEPQYRLLLRAEEVPATRLGRRHGARLGWTSFLTTRKRTTPAAVTLRGGVAMLGTG